MRDQRLNCISPSKYYECVIVFVLKRITLVSLKKVFKKIIFNHWFFSAADRGDEDEMSKRDEMYGYLYGKQKLRKFA